MRSWSWVLLILFTILIKWVSWHPDWVEAHYSKGFYPFIARVQRVLFGWLPFSVGDLLYAGFILIILYKTYNFFRTVFRKKFTRAYFISGLQQMIFFFLFLYVTFNLLWGLNYNRKGIAAQLHLEVKKYSLADLDTLARVMQNRVNYYAGYVTEQERDSFDRKRVLFRGAAEAYKQSAQQYPFLQYRNQSMKPSLFSYLGNYLGFQGYYNPFTGEGQVNTTVPRFIEPYVTTHEIAHQLGYAKESEANFVGYLAARRHPSAAFRYSVYYDMYNYAVNEIFLFDSLLARSIQDRVHIQVQKDQQEFRMFMRKYKNPVEKLIMWAYGQFLKANNQPAGKRSYNEVLIWLIAYYKKYGLQAL